MLGRSRTWMVGCLMQLLGFVIGFYMGRECIHAVIGFFWVVLALVFFWVALALT